MTKSAILWSSGSGQQVDIRVEGDNVYLSIRGGDGLPPWEMSANEKTSVPIGQSLVAVAKAMGLLEREKTVTMGDLNSILDKAQGIAEDFCGVEPKPLTEEPDEAEPEPFDYWNDDRQDCAAYNRRLASELCK